MKNNSSILSFLDRYADDITTIAGAVPVVLPVLVSLGVEIPQSYRDAILTIAVSIIGYYTAKKKESL